MGCSSFLLHIDPHNPWSYSLDSVTENLPFHVQDTFITGFLKVKTGLCSEAHSLSLSQVCVCVRAHCVPLKTLSI